MKVDIPKSWSMKMAALEGDAEIGAGSLWRSQMRPLTFWGRMKRRLSRFFSITN